MADASSDEPVRQSPDADSLSTVRSVGLNGDDLALCLLEQSEDCVKILSIDGTLDFMSCNGLSAMEIDDPSRVLGQVWWTLWPDNSRAMVEDNFKNAIGGRTVTFEASCPTAKGNPRHWSVNLKPMIARDGLVVSVLATSREIELI